MTAQFRDTTYLSDDDMDRMRALLNFARESRALAQCATTIRNIDGGSFTTGRTDARLLLGIDIAAALREHVKSPHRWSRLEDWATGTAPYPGMRAIERAQLREDLIKLRGFVLRGGYGGLIGVTANLG